jgi:hypothetical protein
VVDDGARARPCGFQHFNEQGNKSRKDEEVACPQRELRAGSKGCRIGIGIQHQAAAHTHQEVRDDDDGKYGDGEKEAHGVESPLVAAACPSSAIPAKRPCRENRTIRSLLRTIPAL